MTPPKRAAGQGRAPAGPGCARRSAAPVADAAPPGRSPGLVPTGDRSGTSSLSLPSPEAATRVPDPATGEAESCPVPAAPVRGRAARSPAGGALDADGASPDRSQALFLDLQDAERAALERTRRADAKAFLDAHLAGKMKEAELEEQIRDACKKLGILRFHVHISVGTKAGLPDDILIGPRGILWRECKTAKGKVTAAQQEAGSALLAAGQDWAVWRPADWFSGRIARELAAIAGLRGAA
jgi:hypothetical protein